MKHERRVSGKWIFWLPSLGLIAALAMSFKDDDGLDFLNNMYSKWAYFVWQSLSSLAVAARLIQLYL